eukprot:605434-Pelagomonas_calceolata.AAC.1
MGSQFSSFCLKIWECAEPSMADRTWEDQQSSDLKLSRMSASKIYFIVELLHRSRSCKGLQGKKGGLSQGLQGVGLQPENLADRLL